MVHEAAILGNLWGIGDALKNKVWNSGRGIGIVDVGGMVVEIENPRIEIEEKTKKIWERKKKAVVLVWFGYGDD